MYTIYLIKKNTKIIKKINPNTYHYYYNLTHIISLNLKLTTSYYKNPTLPYYLSSILQFSIQFSSILLYKILTILFLLSIINTTHSSKNKQNTKNIKYSNNILSYSYTTRKKTQL